MDGMELRKLRKKLRQIETLEHLPRELTPCETAKVLLKVELRRHIEEILSQNLEPESEDTGTKEKEHGSLQPSLHPEPPVKKHTPPKTAPKQTAAQPAPKVKLKSRGPLQDSQFLVRSLEGHSDLVTAVLIHDTYIISGSWDTSVRVWDLSSCSELKTLCGHTGAVTCLALVSLKDTQLNSSLLPPREHFVCSGSADSSIKVWSLITGQPLLSIYTFSAVSAIVHIPDTRLIISGSDGGKIDVWDLETQENLQSKRTHEEKVTALQFHAGLLYSGSSDGFLKVWKVSTSGSLSLLHSCDSLSLPLRGLYAVCATADRIYVANQGASLKAVDWKQDGLTRLSNHTSGSGFVDAVAVTPDNFLVASGFNLDQGHGFLNVRDVKTGQYLSTLSHPDVSRLLCLALCRASNGLCRWVTGGKELLMWEELPKRAAGDISAVQVQFCAEFLNPAPESESEEDEGEDLWESDDEGPPSDAPSQTSSWPWCLLQ
ncbi:PREDICTED: F-box/WD repeat-containing protein 7-like [Nanorana parkeri]|uniref:F-box/WD repeat-containing protein 7-like n=1 Tax=Nanorana parkeri TaxID=125878 RepID=UPI000853F909|nr:PREDICTED: F-box/WD repeat-containing protein 7-like [Nanorana parkeri]